MVARLILTRRGCRVFETAALALIITTRLPAQAAPPRPEPPAAAPEPLPSGEPSVADFAPLPGPVDWPTVESTTDADAGADAAAAEVRYSVAVTGLSPLGLEGQFQSLSSLWTKKGGEANLAQINRRIAEDKDLIDQLLRSVGHYGGSSVVTVTPPATGTGKTLVAITVEPGPSYRFDSISIVAPEGAAGPDPAPLVTPLLGIKAGDIVNAARVTAGQDGLAAGLANAGYPFAVIAKPEIVIDHAARTAALLQRIDPGARGVYGTIHIAGETQGFTDEHVAILARFKPGQPYSEAGRDDLRRAVIQTGLFGSVTVKPVAAGPLRADGSQAVDLLVTTERAPVHTVAGTAGYSTGQGIRFEASWANRNLVKPEGGFTVRGVGAEREQLLAADLQRRNWRRRDQTLVLGGGLSAEQQNAFSATTLRLGAAVNRESNIIWQKPITYSVGGELLATRQRDRSAPNDPNNTFYILALPASITWDQSDNFLNPARGFRLTARVSPEFTLRSGTAFNYVKAQFEGTAYAPLGDVVFAARLHFGAITGASRGRIAPDRRFYAGGGGSVRGYGFQGVGPKDSGGSPTGGNSLTEASAEIRYRFHALGSDLGLVGFVDGGQVYETTLPKFSSLQLGAGIGLRYFTGFGPVRIDIATPINPQPGDPKVAFYVSIGQAF